MIGLSDRQKKWVAAGVTSIAVTIVCTFVVGICWGLLKVILDTLHQAYLKPFYVNRCLCSKAIDTIKGTDIHLCGGENIDAFEEIKPKIQNTKAHNSQDTYFQFSGVLHHFL
jgi:hypothetical protein